MRFMFFANRSPKLYVRSPKIDQKLTQFIYRAHFVRYKLLLYRQKCICLIKRPIVYKG